MADEMEQMEARLAAYVDGTLPADQRAEIESYLKANPTHGRLITELRSIKSAIGALPKEKAPAEVLDTLQAHLERHTLLDDVEEVATSTRINRWPQLGALAAVLLLTAGLGILVYQVLPQKNGQSPGLALLPETTQGSGEVDLNATTTGDPSIGSAANGLGGGGGGGGRVFGESDRDPAVESRRQPGRADERVAKLEDQSRTDRLQSLNNQLYQNQFGDNQFANNSFPNNAPQAGASAIPPDTLRAGVAAAPTRVAVVTSDEPLITQNLVAGYLAQNGIAFERIDAPADPVAASSADWALAARQKRSEATFAETPANATNPADSVALAAKRPANEASPASPQPLLIRGLSPSQLADVEAALHAQRPARQRTLAYWAKDTQSPQQAGSADASGVQAQSMATQPTDATAGAAVPQSPSPSKASSPITSPPTTPAATTPAAAAPAGGAVGEALGVDTETQLNFRAALPSTSPATQTSPLPTTNAAEASSTDLVVYVIAADPAAPSPASTQPTTTQPTTLEARPMGDE